MYFSETLGKESEVNKYIPIKTLLLELKNMATQKLYNPIIVLENSYREYLNKIIDACEGWETVESDKILDDSETFEV